MSLLATGRGTVPRRQLGLAKQARIPVGKPISLSSTNRQPRFTSNAAASASAQRSTLKDLDLYPVIDANGFIQPDCKAEAQAFVYAIYDDKKKLQYVGFSRDLRNSLCTVFSRRPDKAHYFKFFPLTTLDQASMIATRDSWFEEAGGTPPGNKLALERSAWQEPVDGGAISERGKQGAAEEKARQLLEMISNRGCKEAFIADPELLVKGQVDFLPIKALSAEMMAAAKEKQEALYKRMSVAQVDIDGETKDFRVLYIREMVTNGGFMVDLTLSFDNKETEHRVIVGKDYYEPYKLSHRAVIEACFAVLLTRKVPRRTDGILACSDFPIMYFSMTEMEQRFPEEFTEQLRKVAGQDRAATSFYRWNRIHDYGFNLEAPDAWAILGPSGPDWV